MIDTALTLQNTSQLAKWYEQYADELFAYGMAFGMEKAFILDAIHDIFLRLYESADRLEMPENPKFYLLRALKNKIVSHRRSPLHWLSLDDSADYAFRIHVDACALIEDEEERRKYEKQVENLLALLTDKQREVVYLHFMEELSYQEIAALLHVTPKSIRKTIYRALERMQKEKMPFILFSLLIIAAIEKR